MTGKSSSGKDVPRVFRLNIEVSDLEAAAAFYGKLLGTVGRKQAGSRCTYHHDLANPATLPIADRPLPANASTAERF